MPAIRTRSYLSDDATLKANGIDRTEVFFVYAFGTDDGLGAEMLVAADVFSPSHSTDRDQWMLVLTCPVCTIRHILEDSIVGGEWGTVKVFDPKKIARLAEEDPFTLQQVQQRCSLQVDRGPGSHKEWDVAREWLSFEGRRYEGLLTVSPHMACSYCPEAEDGRQFAVTFPRPGYAIQAPGMKLWPMKQIALAKAG